MVDHVPNTETFYNEAIVAARVLQANIYQGPKMFYGRHHNIIVDKYDVTIDIFHVP